MENIIEYKPAFRTDTIQRGSLIKVTADSGTQGYTRWGLVNSVGFDEIRYLYVQSNEDGQPVLIDSILVADLVKGEVTLDILGGPPL